VSADTPVGVDPARLTPWITEHAPGFTAPFTFHRVAGGHSCLTYIVTDAAGAKLVLRRPPIGELLASAHDVIREHRIMSALADTGVPLPRMIAACTDTVVNDAPFYLMSCVEGVVLHDAGSVPELLPSLEARRNAGFSMVKALAALHAVDVDEVGLGDLARRTGYLDRQLKRWSGQWEASKTRELPTMDRLHTWLVANRPEEGTTRIVHGDFRLGNALHAPDGTVQAILDWELCTLGDATADVAYLMRSWSRPSDGPAVSSSMLPASRSDGFPEREELVAAYEAATGKPVGDLAYWIAFNAWRLAAINEGVYRRYIDGKMGALPDDVHKYARSVETTAESGLVAAGID
jgi:aminoglycoside phosphotransferase (APT) family kinase protein